MTLEEILLELEKDGEFDNIFEEEEPNEGQSNQQHEQNYNSGNDNANPEETNQDDAKLHLLDNINRLVVIKDVLTSLNNYKQDNDIASLLNKTRILLLSIAKKVKDNTYTANIDQVNNEVEQLIKLIIVYVKNKVDPKFKKRYLDRVEKLKSRSENEQ